MRVDVKVEGEAFSPHSGRTPAPSSPQSGRESRRWLTAHLQEDSSAPSPTRPASSPLSTPRLRWFLCGGLPWAPGAVQCGLTVRRAREPTIPPAGTHARGLSARPCHASLAGLAPALPRSPRAWSGPYPMLCSSRQLVPPGCQFLREHGGWSCGRETCWAAACRRAEAGQPRGDAWRHCRCGKEHGALRAC